MASWLAWGASFFTRGGSDASEDPNGLSQAEHKIKQQLSELRVEHLALKREYTQVQKLKADVLKGSIEVTPEIQTQLLGQAELQEQVKKTKSKMDRLRYRLSKERAKFPNRPEEKPAPAPRAPVPRSTVACAVADSMSNEEKNWCWGSFSVRELEENDGHVLDLDVVGSMLVTASSNSTIQIYDMSREEWDDPVRVLAQHTKQVCSVQINRSPPHDILSGSADGSVRIWNSTNGRSIARFYYGSHTNAAIWAADGSSVIAGSEDGKIRLFDVVSQKCVQTLKAHDSGVRSLRLAPPTTAGGAKKGGKAAAAAAPPACELLVSASENGSICIWEVQPNSIETTPKHEIQMYSDVLSLHVSHHIFCGSFSKHAHEFDLKGQFVRKFRNQIGTRAPAYAIAYSQHVLVISSLVCPKDGVAEEDGLFTKLNKEEDQDRKDFVGCLRVYSLPSGRYLYSLYDADPQYLCLRIDGSSIFAGLAGGGIKIFDLLPYEAESEERTHENVIGRVDYDFGTGADLQSSDEEDSDDEQ